MKRFLLSIFVCCAFCWGTTAQVGTLNAVQQPLNPDVAGLGKYIELPVGYYTGIPEVGIPLYELKTKDLSVPVSLSYHASGIKRREIPGLVGAGFSLNAGGVITRIVRGYPDGNDLNAPAGYKAIARQFGQPGFPVFDQRNFQGVISEFTPSKMDGEFDQFYFNFMGRSGSFTFTNEGKLIMNVMNNMKGEYSNDHHFKLTDENGIEYHFNDLEMSSEPTFGGFISVWYLSKIVNPFKNELVSFNYQGYGVAEPYTYSYGPPSFYSEHLYQDKSPHPEYMPVGMQNPACEYNSSPRVMPYPVLNNGVETKILKQIIYKTDTIKFYRDFTHRSDIYKLRLDSMNVFSGTKLVHRVAFKFTYSDLVTTDPLKRKMLLDSVKINDQTPYAFAYIDSYMGKKMPGIHNPAEDVWGYYNGEDSPFQENGNRIFSRYKIYDHRYPVTDNSSYRNSDYKYAQIGSLKAITYPTGGKTEFEYEGNDFAYTNDGPLENPDGNLLTLVFDSVRTAGIRNSGSMTAYENPFVKTNEVTIHHDQTVTIQTKLGLQDEIFTLDNYLDWVYNGGMGIEGIVRLTKYNTSTGVFDVVEERSFNPVDVIGLPANQPAFAAIRMGGISTESHTRVLTEGVYRIEAQVLPGGVMASVKLTNVFRYMKPGPKYTAGGLRIKKIKFTSPQNEASYEKNFDYSYKGKSSGIMESTFSNLTTKMYWGERRVGNYVCGYSGVDPQLCLFFVIHQENMIPLGNAKGGVIGYAQVTENLNDGSKKLMQFTNGYTYGMPYDSIFDFYADGYASNDFDEVFIRDRKILDFSDARGKMKLVEYYKNNQKIKKEVHKYMVLGPGPGSPEAGNNISIYPVQQAIVVNAPTCYVYPQYISAVGALIYSSMQINPVPVVDSIFYYNGTDTLKDITRYQYDNGAYTFPSETVKINSAGDSTSTYYRYPFDYTISGTSAIPFSKGIKNMLDKHVIARPVETFVKKNAKDGALKVVEAQLVSYKPDLPFPDTVYTLKNTVGLSDFSPAQFTAGTASMDHRYERKLVFSKYQQGDVVEQHKEGDAKEVLLWGYRRRHIVARVLSSDFNTVIALVDTNVLNNPSSDGALRTELNKIRTALAGSNPKAKVTSYTYDPLIGMTSTTDPRGEIVYYEYDKYGRLKRLKDANGDLKQNNWYHYKP